MYLKYYVRLDKEYQNSPMGEEEGKVTVEGDYCRVKLPAPVSVNVLDPIINNQETLSNMSGEEA